MELSSSHAKLDVLNQRGGQLVKSSAELLPHFSPARLQLELQGANDKWEDATQVRHVLTSGGDYSTVNSQLFGTLFNNDDFYGLRVAHVF